MNEDPRFLLVGTAKGLLVYALRSQAKLTNVHFVGFSVNMIYVDPRINRWWVGVSHKHWGEKLHFSDDYGKTWQIAPSPSFEGALLPGGKPAKLRQIWCMHHGGLDRPGELWLGTDPGGLFKSEDNGQTFRLVESLWNHPSRQNQTQWFGAGSDFPFIHSIVVNPKDPHHLYIAVSCAGVFETVDGGNSWHPKNQGLVAAYLPNPNVEVGHDPHHLIMSSNDPSILWQQNHCGVFFTKDGGENWQDVSNKEQLPYYGFAIAINEDIEGTAWVIPVESDEQRVAPDLRIRVLETSDFGKSWQSVSSGLPVEKFFGIVLRQAFATKANHMVFGTTNGHLYYSIKSKVHWSLLTDHLTKVNSVFIS